MGFFKTKEKKDPRGAVIIRYLYDTFSAKHFVCLPVRWSRERQAIVAALLRLGARVTFATTGVVLEIAKL